jgi:hypothetical protein
MPHNRPGPPCPKSGQTDTGLAKSALCQSRLNAPQQKAPLFDHLATHGTSVGGRSRLARKDSPNGIYGISSAADAELLCLDVGCPDHLAPLLGFVGDELAKAAGEPTSTMPPRVAGGASSVRSRFAVSDFLDPALRLASPSGTRKTPSGRTAKTRNSMPTSYGKRVKQSFGLFQITGVEALSKPAVDWSQKICGLIRFALSAQKTRHA